MKNVKYRNPIVCRGDFHPVYWCWLVDFPSYIRRAQWPNHWRWTPPLGLRRTCTQQLHRNLGFEPSGLYDDPASFSSHMNFRHFRFDFWLAVFSRVFLFWFFWELIFLLSLRYLEREGFFLLSNIHCFCSILSCYWNIVSSSLAGARKPEHDYICVSMYRKEK